MIHRSLAEAKAVQKQLLQEKEIDLCLFNRSYALHNMGELNDRLDLPQL